jgi:hypothetical protein
LKDRALRPRLPWFVPAAAVATTSIIVGIIWDISWHRTIGRDTFWTPAHMAIYLGGILAGASGAWLILQATFSKSGDLAARSVRVWGFRGPLGAWISIWGATAMVTSAPFDDWWHNAYGLDVKILSPPHAVLGLGMIAIQIGVLILVLSHQNRADAASRRIAAPIFAYTGGALLLTLVTILMEESLPNNQHRGQFYKIAAGVYPLFLVAVARATPLRWPATAAAGVYTAISLAMSWILPLFPARPLLAPILTPVDHMVPPPFPLLLLVPAVAADLVLRRLGTRDWAASLALGVAFLWTFFVVQYWFAELMLSPAAHNWFFAGGQWGYFTPQVPGLHRFWRQRDDAVSLHALLVATALAVASSRVGLWWGGWMRRVVR